MIALLTAPGGTCTVSGSTVTVGATTGTFQVVVPVTTSVAVASYINPRSGGICRVDPNNIVSESNESNNDCNTDTVVVSKADTSTSITSIPFLP